MKACFLVANHPPEAWGGTEQVVVALARELRGLGVEVVVVSGSDAPHDGVDVLREEFAGVVVHRVPKRPDEWDRQGFVRPRLHALVRALLAQERPDVLHVHSSASLGLGLTPLARGLGIPVVTTFHDLWTTCARYFRLPVPGVVCPEGVEREPCVRCVATDVGLPADEVRAALAERDRLVRAEVAAAGALTAPSATAARFVRECLPCAQPIEVVPHGLLRAVAAADRAAPPQPGERLRVGTFGGLVAEKGVVELLDAVAGLPVELRLSGRVYHAELAARIASAQRAGGGDLGAHQPVALGERGAHCVGGQPDVGRDAAHARLALGARRAGHARDGQPAVARAGGPQVVERRHHRDAEFARERREAKAERRRRVHVQHVGALLRQQRAHERVEARPHEALAVPFVGPLRQAVHDDAGELLAQDVDAGVRFVAAADDDDLDAEPAQLAREGDYDLLGAAPGLGRVVRDEEEGLHDARSSFRAAARCARSAALRAGSRRLRWPILSHSSHTRSCTHTSIHRPPNAPWCLR